MILLLFFKLWDMITRRGNHLHARAAVTALTGWLPTGVLCGRRKQHLERAV